MQNQYTQLTPESADVKGNNPFELNRMTVSDSFKSNSFDVTQIQGYSATGEIIFKNTPSSSQTNHNMVFQGQDPSCKKDQSCWASDQYKSIKGHLRAANEICGVAKFKEESQGANIEGFVGAPINKNVKSNKSWTDEFNPNGSFFQSNLNKEIQNRYTDIMNEESTFNKYS